MIVQAHVVHQSCMFLSGPRPLVIRFVQMLQDFTQLLRWPDTSLAYSLCVRFATVRYFMKV